MHGQMFGKFLSTACRVSIMLTRADYATALMSSTVPNGRSGCRASALLLQTGWKLHLMYASHPQRDPQMLP